MTKARHIRSTFITRSLATLAAVAVTTLVVGAGVRTASASISSDHSSAASLVVMGSLDASGILPGGEVERLVGIHVAAGTTPKLTVTAETSSVLDQDTRNGLQLRADACSSGWRRTETGFSCSGAVTTLFTSRPVIGRSSLPAGGASALTQVRLTLSLPGTADARFMGQTSALSYRIAV
jgi:spore coat-associated protein N